MREPCTPSYVDKYEEAKRRFVRPELVECMGWREKLPIGPAGYHLVSTNTGDSWWRKVWLYAF